MASTIDPTIWDADGPIAKSTIKASLAQAAKNDIEALQEAVEEISGDSGTMPTGRIRGRLSAGTGAVESLTPADAKSVLAYDLSEVDWDPEDTGASTDPSVALRTSYGLAATAIQPTDVFPAPGTVESDAGEFELDWDTDFDGPRVVTLARADADESETLLAILPEIPDGHWATVRITEQVTFVAPARTFVVTASWTDDEGAGEITITQSGVTTATLGLAVGDAVSGGPFGSPTTISEIVSDSVFKTTAAAGGTSSGSVNVVAPAYSIDGARQLTSAEVSGEGIFMVFTRLEASTATTRGLIKSGERADLLDAIQEAIEAATSIPEGTNGAAGRDGAGEVVLFTNDDGSVTFTADGANRYIRAVTALAAHARSVVEITADTTSLATHLVTQVEAGTSNTGSVVLKLEHGTPATALTYTFAKSSAVTPAGGAVVLWVSPDQEGTVTLNTEDNAGTINGETSVEVVPGFVYTALIVENAGSAPTIYLSGPVRGAATVLQGGVHERVVTASVSGAVTIDMSAGSHHVLTMTGNVTGVTLSGRAPDGMSANVRVDWVQDGSGGHSIAHPTGTRWAGGTAPTFVTTAGAVNTVAYSAIGASGVIDGFDGGMGRATP